MLDNPEMIAFLAYLEREEPAMHRSMVAMAQTDIPVAYPAPVEPAPVAASE